jgi:hypothetical protein
MRTLTQQERVLRSLTQTGQRGITAADWTRQPTPDGGPPIQRLAARIGELRQAGHEIPDTGERRDKCTIYRLDRNHTPIAESTIEAAAHEPLAPPARLWPRSPAPGAPATRPARPPNPYEYEQEQAA